MTIKRCFLTIIKWGSQTKKLNNYEYDVLLTYWEIYAKELMGKSYEMKKIMWLIEAIQVKEMIPKEKSSGLKPKLDCFKVFWSIAHVHIPNQKRTKLGDRSHKCILIGVNDESKAYWLYDPILNKIIVSMDIIFEEGEKWNQNVNSEETKEITLYWGVDGSDMEGFDE